MIRIENTINQSLLTLGSSFESMIFETLAFEDFVFAIFLFYVDEGMCDVYYYREFSILG